MMVDKYGVEAMIVPEPGEVEQWRPAPGYEDRYEISSFGNIRRKINKRLRKIRQDHYGYPCVCLRINNKVHFVYIHRLVCEAFWGAPTQDHKICDHRDRCVVNNYYKNLHWTDNSGNVLNTTTRKKKRLTTTTTPIIFYNLEGQEQQRFSSILEAHEKMGISVQQIIHNLHMRREPFKNGYFKLAQDEFDC